MTPTEEARVAASDENEIVLIERPLFVKVRIVKPRTIATAADDKEDGPVLYLKPRVVEWTRNATTKAKVKRIGFPLVPEFGGAVHAYCAPRWTPASRICWSGTSDRPVRTCRRPTSTSRASAPSISC